MLAKEKWQIRTIAVLEKVFEERQRQVSEYGFNEDLEDGTGPDAQWLTPLASEFADSIESRFREDYEEHEEQEGLPTWMHLVREELAEAFLESDQDRLAEELAQVAALCVSWIEVIQKRRDLL